MMTTINLEDVTFLGMNIPKEVENIIKKISKDLNIPEEHRTAYDLGVQNTISILKQMLDYDVDSESIVFYNPNVDTTEEMSVEDVVEWLEER